MRGITIAFDIDDTLYHERDYVRSGLRAVGSWLAARYETSDFFDVAWAKFESGARGQLFDETLPMIGIRPDQRLIRRLVREYRGHIPSITLLPDAERALTCLRETTTIAIVTDGPLLSQQAKARALQLETFADPIIYTEALGQGRSKPHPEAFEIIMATHGRPGPSCVYVADNPTKDFQAPRQLGWRTVRVVRPAGLHAEKESKADVDVEILDLSGLAAILAGWRVGKV